MLDKLRIKVSAMAHVIDENLVCDTCNEKFDKLGSAMVEWLQDQSGTISEVNIVHLPGTPPNHLENGCFKHTHSLTRHDLSLEDVILDITLMSHLNISISQ